MKRCSMGREGGGVSWREGSIWFAAFY